MIAHIAETDDRLIIRLRPVKVWAYWLFGLIFVALGLMVMLLLGRAIRLTCAADPKGQCELTRVTVAWSTAESFPVSELGGARVDTVTAGVTARMDLVLQTASGDRTLSLSAADGNEKLRLAEEVRRFVADPAASPLEIGEDSRPIGIPFALFVMGAGVFIMLVLETVVVVADRAEGTLRVRSRRFPGGRSAVVRLDEIESVETPSFQFRATASSSVVLHLTGGRELGLTRTPLFTAASARKVAGAIARFRGTA